MKVSIITTTCNNASTIQQTLHSVRAQSYRNIEHIIVDGFSTDGTLAIIEKYNDGRLFSVDRNGAYDAMNKGIAEATGDIIGILNADDHYSNPEVIATVVATIRRKKSEAVYGDLLYVDQLDGNQVKRTWISGGYNKLRFYLGWMPPHPTFFVKKEIYQKYGLFNLQLQYSGDYELLLRFMLKRSIEVAYIRCVLVKMRTGGQSNNCFKNRWKAHKEDYKAWQLNCLYGSWLIVPLKPLRKIVQYHLHDIAQFLSHFGIHTIRQSPIIK